MIFVMWRSTTLFFSLPGTHSRRLWPILPTFDTTGCPVQSRHKLRALGTQLIGQPLDGRAGLHVYFLLRALQLLSPNGRLAFIVPADTCEGVFAPRLWRWVASNYRLDAVITFAPEASPFPGVDTNPVIILLRNLPPSDSFHWVKCMTPGTGDLQEWIRSGFETEPDNDLVVSRRDLHEGVATGLTRAPVLVPHDGPTLADFAGVQRGIATGANDFFFLTRQQAAALHLPAEFLVPAIGRTRDVPGDTVTAALLRELDSQGRPTLLFCPDGRPLQDFPQPVRAYLQTGAERGLSQKTLIATRNPWYKMEFRTPPPFLFTYLGRRNTRFIRNLAGVVPLTGFPLHLPPPDRPNFSRCALAGPPSSRHRCQSRAGREILRRRCDQSGAASTGAVAHP